MNFEQNFEQPLDPNSPEYQSLNQYGVVPQTPTKGPVPIKTKKIKGTSIPAQGEFIGLNIKKETRPFAILEGSIRATRQAGDEYKDYSLRSEAQSGKLGVYGDLIAPGESNPKEINDKLINENKQLLSQYASEIDKPINDLLNSGKWKDFFTKDGILDESKAKPYFEKISTEKGGGSYIRDTLKAKFEQEGKKKIDAEQVQGIFKEEAKKANLPINDDGSIDLKAAGIDLTKYGAKALKDIAPDKFNKLELIKSDADSVISGKLTELKSIASTMQNGVGLIQQDLVNKIKNGLITQEDAQVELDKANTEYTNTITGLDAEFKKFVRDANLSATQKYSRIQKELDGISGTITIDDVLKRMPEAERNKVKTKIDEVKGRVNSVYEKSYNKLYESKELVKRASEDIGGLGGLATKSFVSGWSQGLAALGGYMNMHGVENSFADWLTSNKTTAEETAPAQYKWNGEDWLKRGVSSSMSSMGASLPITIPSIAISAAGTAVGVPAAGIGLLTGVIGYLGERAQNTDEVYKKELSKSGNAAQAYDKAIVFENESKKELPFFILGGLLEAKLFQLGANSIKSTSKSLGKSILEVSKNYGGQVLLEEYPTELIQGFNQAKADGYKNSITDYAAENPEIFLDTVVSTVGQSSMFYGAGKVFGAFTKSVPESGVQFYTNLIQTKGAPYARFVAEKYYQAGILDQSTATRVVEEVNKITAINSNLKESGLDDNAIKLYMSLTEQSNNLKKVLAEEESEMTPFYQQKLKDVNSQLSNLAKNELPYIVLGFPGGNDSRVISVSTFQSLPLEKQVEVIKASNTIDVVNDNKLNESIKIKKQQLGNTQGAPNGMFNNNINIQQNATQESGGTQQEISKQGSIGQYQGTEGQQAPETNETNLGNRPVSGTQEVINFSVPEAISNVQSSLESTGVKVQVVENEQEYDKLVEDMGGQRGTDGLFNSNNGTILLNPTRLKQSGEAGRIIWHEGAHPVMNIIRNTNKPVYDAVISGLKKAAESNPELAQSLAWAKGGYTGDARQMDEAIVETIGKLNDGTLDINTIPTGFKQSIIDVINLIAQALGLGQVLEITDIAQFKKVAGEVANALKTGTDVSSIVGKENVQKFQDNIDSPEVAIAGNINKDAIPQARVIEKPVIDVYATKEMEKLPVRSMEDVYNQYGGKATIINSDPTRTGTLILPSGKEIFMYGGPGYLAISDNANNGIGFATTAESKVGSNQKYIKELFGGNKGVTLIGTQTPNSMLSNSYALRYVLDAISLLPKTILKSTEFKNEFFGKDLVLLKAAFGEKGYNEFVEKYKKSDLSSQEVIDGMINEMGYKLGNDNRPATFKARRAFVENLLAGVVEKSSRAGNENEVGYVSKTPNKFVAKSLFDRMGLNAEKLFYEIGEKSLVDAYMKEGKWGFAVAGFEVDPNADTKSIQSLGVAHPLFNAKFPATNSFILDGAYQVDDLFKPVEITSGKGNAYTKKASQMLAGSMYVKGEQEQKGQSFEYKPAPSSADKIQARVNSNTELVNGFYSPIENAVNELQQKKGTGEQMLAMIKKGKNITSDELEFTGIEAWLKDKESVNKEDIVDFIKNNKIQVKDIEKVQKEISWTNEVDDNNQPYLSAYVPGGIAFIGSDEEGNTTYRLPGQFSERLAINEDDAIDIINAYVSEKSGSAKFEQYQLAGEKKNYKEVLITIPKNNGEFINPVHFNELNIVAHIRMNTRKDSEGNNTLFLEEIQSDWAQDGRKKGFRKLSNDNKNNIAEIEKKLNDLGYVIENGKVASRQQNSIGVEIFMYRNANDLVGEARILANEVAKIYKGVAEAPYVQKTDAWVKLALKKAIQEAILQDLDRVSWTTGNQQGERYPGDPTRTAGMNAFYGNENESGIVGKVAKKLIKEFTGKDGDISLSTINGIQQPSIEITPEIKAAVKEGIPQFRKSSIKFEKSKEGKGDPSISSRNEFVMKAANDLKNGKISNEEYRAVVSENSPIRPITRFFEPATKKEMLNALSVDKRNQINQPIEDGKIVGLRLDIPAYKNNNTWVVSVHDGNTNTGKVLSYDNVARIKNVTFGVEPKGALAIATGKPKATIGRMFGEWQNIDGETMEAKGESAKKIIQEVVGNPEWIQVGMNPFRHSYFYDRSSDMGRPVNKAEEVVQLGGLVYAKNPEYGNWTDESYRVKDLFDKNKAPVQFRKGLIPTGGVPSVPGETGIEKVEERGLPEKVVYSWEKGPEKEIPQGGETMISTSTGRYVAVETMAGQQMDREKKLSEIEKAKPSFFSASYSWLKTALIDNQAMVLGALAKIGKQGQLVKAYLLTRNSSSATATTLSENAIKDIYGDISKKKMFNINGAKISEYQLLNQLIGYQRVISIQQQMNDVYKNMIQALRNGDMRAYNINKQRLIDNNMIDKNGDYVGENLDKEFAMGQVTSTQAKALLNETRDAIGEEAFGKLMNSSKKYSDFLNSMLKSRMEAGLITEESYKYLSKFFYAPTRYISDILTDPILSLTRTSTSFRNESILRVKQLAGGSEKLNMSDYEGLLKAVTYASEYSIAENRATTRFYNLVSENPTNFAASGIRMGTRLEPIVEKTGAEAQQVEDVIDRSARLVADGKKPNPLQLPSGQKQLPYKGVQKIGEMGIELYQAPTDIIIDKDGNKFKVIQEPLKEGEDYIKTYFDGQRYDIIVPAWFAEQWYNKNTTTSPYITTATSFLSKVTGANFLRVVATGINPVFGIAQLIPDTISAYASTLEERKLPLLVDYPIFFAKVLVAAKDIKGNSKDFQEAMKYGATTNFYNGGMVSFEQGLLGKEDKSLEKVIESWNVPGLKQYIIGSKKITETTEQMSKVALYKSIRDSKLSQFSKDNGRAPNAQEIEDIRIEAGALARGTADFHRKGVLGGELNKVIPYLNAGFQVQRAILGSAKENPKKALYYAMEFATYGAMLTLSALGMGDDDELKEKKRKAYLKLSDFDRDNRAILYYIESKDRFVSVKLPEFLVSMQSLQRRMVERNYLENKPLNNKDVLAIASNVADAIPTTQFANIEKMLSRNPAYSFIAKLKYNRDPYRQEEVVPYEKATKDYLEGAEAGKKRSGKIYQAIGKGAVSPLLPEGISPKRLETAVGSIPFQSNPFSGAILAGLEWSTSDKDLFAERYGKDTRDKILKASGLTDRYMKEGSKINQNITDLPMEEVKGRGEFKNTIAEMLIPKFDSAVVNLTRPEAFKKVRTEFINNEYKKLTPEQKEIARGFIEGELKSIAKAKTKDEFVLQVSKMAGSDAKVDAILETISTIKVSEASKVQFIRDLVDAGLVSSPGTQKTMNVRGRKTLTTGEKNPYYEPKVGYIRDEILKYVEEKKKPQ